MEKIRIGIFGLMRGGSYIQQFIANNGEIVAICDKSEERVKKAVEEIGDGVACYSDFDSFIEHPMDAVFLANYFHEHSKYAVTCLEKNIHVLSECTSNSTMAEGVALVRAAEKSDAIYMIAENYPFMLFNQEIKKVCDGGTLGKILYAEGEYNHGGNPYSANVEMKRRLYDDYDKHWRLHNPRTYYITHSIGPLMYATGAMPIRVTATPIFAPSPADSNTGTYVGDKATVMVCLNDDDSVFKITASSAYGYTDNSYRVCGEKGQIENVRGSGGMVSLNYNSWQVPEGRGETNYYKPVLVDKDIEHIKKAGHGGGDFFVVREFFDCIRENKTPVMDVYFATRMASVGILAHRSVLDGSMPYDIPDFRKEEDRKKYENDTLSPFWYSDGTAPTIPCCSRPDYKPSDVQVENFKKFFED